MQIPDSHCDWTGPAQWPVASLAGHSGAALQLDVHMNEPGLRGFSRHAKGGAQLLLDGSQDSPKVLGRFTSCSESGLLAQPINPSKAKLVNINRQRTAGW